MLWLLLGLFAMPVLLCGFAVSYREPLSAWALVNIAVYPALVLGSIALHEAGHALVARAVGLRVPRITIGIGRRWARWRRGGTTYLLNAFPLSAMTSVGGDPARGLRWRYWVSIAVGPLVTLAILGVVLAWGPPLSLREIAFPTAAVASRVALRELIGFANLWMLAANLLPLPAHSFGIGLTDGRQLLTVPFASAKRLEALRTSPAVLDALDASEDEDHERARQILETALQRFPGSWTLRNSLAIVDLKLERLGEARAEFLALVEAEPPTPDARWIARNNLAWVDYRLRADELRDEADAHSEAVLREYKGAGWAMGTRGAVLSWLGRHREAVPLLEGAYLRNSIPANRAFNAAALAVSLAALGRMKEATVWLERVKANHPKSPLLAEATAAVAAATNR